MKIPLPETREGRLALTMVVVSLLLLMRLVSVQTQLDAKPEIEDTKKVNKKKGPSHTETFTKINPDGSKEIRKVKDEGPSETNSETTHKETPVVRLPTRYVGVALSPLDYQRPRVSVGITVHGRLDLGGYWDTKRRLDDGALGLEARYRF